MDPEKRGAIRAHLKPDRELVKSGCGLLVFGAIALAVSGHWLSFFFLLVAGFVAMMAFGARLQRIGPPNDFQRSSYRSALMVSGLPDEPGNPRLPEGVAFVFAFSRVFLARTGGHSEFVNAARDGTAGKDWLVKKLDSEEPFDRWRAIIALERMSDERLPPVLKPLLEDSDSRVREAAASAIGSVANPEAMEILEHKLVTIDDDVEWLAAVSRLYEHGRTPMLDPARIVRAINTIQTEQRLDRSRLAPMLAPLPIDLVEDDLRSALSDSGARLQALRLLARSPDPRAVAIVRDALASADQRERISAILALPLIPPSAYEEDLRRIATSGKGHDRKFAQRRLERMQSHKGSVSTE